MNGLNEWSVAIVSVAGALTALGLLARKARGAYREAKKDGRAFKDAILGREEILHPDTGAVLAPAVPGIGSRMATIEAAVVEMANTHARVDRLEVRVTALEAKDVERALARTESIELMRTIDAAIKSTPQENQ